MTKLNIVLTKNALDDIRRIDRQVAVRIRKKLAAMAGAKQSMNSAVRLTKPADAQYRWRIGQYRVLFDLDAENNTAVILKVQHRKEIYRR